MKKEGMALMLLGVVTVICLRGSDVSAGVCLFLMGVAVFNANKEMEEN